VVVRDLWQFLEQKTDWPITLINTVPSTMSQILAAQALPESVKTVNLAGEALTHGLVQQIYRYPSVRKVYNLYGPSEDTTYSTWNLVSRDDAKEPVIGLPIINTRYYVLDEGLQLVPRGVIGELYLAGDGLARGYLERPELTAERFLPNPWASIPGERMYKTGDLVRYRSSGELEYIGRNDQQVKLRGYRIELGEIEAALQRHEWIQEAVVVVREDTPGDRRLVAYVVLAEGGESAFDDVHRSLQERLPAYMLPATWVVMEHIPLTPNGKIDRKALPQPSGERSAIGNKKILPRTSTEEAIVRIWQEVLKLQEIGVFDNFFELGGHSLLATSVVSRLRARFQIALPLGTLFIAPSVAQLARYVELSVRETELVAPIPRLPRAPYYPLSTAQQGIWFLEQLTPNSLRYNMSFALRLSGTLHVAKLSRSLSEVVRRHDALRTLFGIEKGQPVQRVMPASEWVLVPEDISSPDEYERIKDQEAHQRFDLHNGPLLRVRLLRLSDTEHILLLNLHHLIADGWSMSIFARELAVLYESWPEGQPSPLPDLTVQYSDYAAWHRQYVQEHVFETQLAYWKQQLAAIPETLNLPTDHPRPAVQTYNGTQRIFFYPPELLQSLREVSQREGVTLFMTLLAAFTVLLMRYSGQEDIVVGSPIAGRVRPEAEEMIGLFINTLALRSDLSGNPLFCELLQRVRRTTLDAYAHQDLPFDQVVEAVQPKRSISHPPLFQVVMALQNIPMPPREMMGVTLTPLEVILHTAKYDLIFSFVETPDGLQVIRQHKIWEETLKVGAQLTPVRLHLRLRNNISYQALLLKIVLVGHNDALLHVLMGIENCLDLARFDTIAAYLDLVIETAHAF
jgi:acyl carrier protein